VPELPEIEVYRSFAAAAALRRRITRVDAPDPWFLKRTTAEEVTEALLGRRFVRARRRGKLLLLDTDKGGPVLGLRFGMTGRLVIDGSVAMDALLYSSALAKPGWDRFGVDFGVRGVLRINDPRRLGGVELDPDEGALGPDALTITRAQLGGALDRSAAPLKARLLDQAHIAGVGNLCADEALWRAGLSPLRPAGRLKPREVTHLHTVLVATLVDLSIRGGSHTGDLMPERRPGGHCPRDGKALARNTVGGRTSWWCPKHQR
jgi:formamidopyrimidine-DNA glycosylase